MTVNAIIHISSIPAHYTSINRTWLSIHKDSCRKQDRTLPVRPVCRDNNFHIRRLMYTARSSAAHIPLDICGASRSPFRITSAQYPSSSAHEESHKTLQYDTTAAQLGNHINHTRCIYNSCPDCVNYARVDLLVHVGLKNPLCCKQYACNPALIDQFYANCIWISERFLKNVSVHFASSKLSRYIFDISSKSSIDIGVKWYSSTINQNLP